MMVSYGLSMILSNNNNNKKKKKALSKDLQCLTNATTICSSSRLPLHRRTVWRSLDPVASSHGDPTTVNNWASNHRIPLSNSPLLSAARPPAGPSALWHAENASAWPSVPAARSSHGGYLAEVSRSCSLSLANPGLLRVLITPSLCLLKPGASGGVVISFLPTNCLMFPPLRLQSLLQSCQATRSCSPTALPPLPSVCLPCPLLCPCHQENPFSPLNVRTSSLSPCSFQRNQPDQSLHQLHQRYL